KALPASIAAWVPGRLVTLGTDGFGRSDSRKGLRDFFEVDARFVTVAALSSLAREGQLPKDVVQKTIKDLDVNPEKPNPATA
ncbi:MAG: hypothetical protein HYS05_09885, partial [Acidobacteria bacterium]|nr:hypothetical protein [Acidobacteriota bacterium]